MIEIAGGENMISKTGEHSRRLDMDEISRIKSRHHNLNAMWI